MTVTCHSWSTGRPRAEIEPDTHGARRILRRFPFVGCEAGSGTRAVGEKKFSEEALRRIKSQAQPPELLLDRDSLPPSCIQSLKTPGGQRETGRAVTLPSGPADCCIMRNGGARIVQYAECAIRPGKTQACKLLRDIMLHIPWSAGTHPA